MKLTMRPIFVFALVASFCSSALSDEYLNGITWESPAIVDPGETDAAPPSDATVLFGGEDASKWQNGENWAVKDGILFAGKGRIVSKDQFGDCQIHIEWSAPMPAKGNGQGRGNSGLFMNGIYELQILDSYENETYHDGQAGAIYKQTPPMVNAMRGPGKWNTYDVIWTAPRFNEDGTLKSPAYITAIHNGVVIQNHFELRGDTPYNRPPEYKKHALEGPIAIQDHGNPVRFRNIWVREISPAKGEQTRTPFLRNGKKERPIE